MKICIQFIEGTEHAEQFRGGLLADARHTWNVVDAISSQRQEVGDELGRDSEARANVVVVIARVAAVIPEYVAVAYQLRQILVACHQNVAQTRGARARRQGSDDVVGLVFGARELRQSHMPAKLAA